MCLILFAHDAHPEFRLVLAANRDEFHERPTEPAHRWPEAPWIVAGRDLRGGGTWLGVTDQGRWAAVTNVRDPAEFGRTAPSRGLLVSEYLAADDAPGAYAAQVAARMHELNGFNLLLGDGESVWWISNRGPELAGPIEPGIHGVSNAALDSPWPKVVRGKQELERLLSAGSPQDSDQLMHLLLDRTVAADANLPRTGVALDLERALSAAFIDTPGYGTRSSTVLLIDRSGTIEMFERTYDPARPSRGTGAGAGAERRFRLGPHGQPSTKDPGATPAPPEPREP